MREEREMPVRFFDPRLTDGEECPDTVFPRKMFSWSFWSPIVHRTKDCKADAQDVTQECPAWYKS